MGEVRQGQVAGLVAGEIPGIAIFTLGAEPSPRGAQAGLTAELAMAADRVHGADAVRVGERPVPAAYRAVIRQLGMDPDNGPSTTLESVTRTRLMEGGFRPKGLVADAMTLVSLEFGVPLFSFAAGKVSGTLGIAQVTRTGNGFAQGEIVLADDDGPVAGLFRDPPREVAPAPDGPVVFACVEVEGVGREICLAALARAATLVSTGRPE